MREMHHGSSGRSRSAERGSTHLKKHMVASSNISQNYYSMSPDLSKSSAKKSSGVPIRCLIEEEFIMKEKKTRHPSPGVIARLMGLDTLPSPPPPKSYPENQGLHCHKKKVEASQKAVHREPSVTHERCVFTEDELPEFKDVFEITEARKAKKKFHSSPVHSKNSSPEVEFVRKKFAEAKRLSTEEPLHSSREFNDTLEALESNRDALLEFLSEPNFLFTKQIKDLSFLPPSPPRSASQITILKPSSKRNTGIDSEIGRDFDQDNDYHYRKHGNDLSNHQCEDDFVSLTFDKPLKSNYKARGEKCSRPTNIVVLKPSLDKARKTVGAGAFPVFYPEVSARSKFINGEESFSGTRARSSREIARHVTRQMRRAVSTKHDYLPDVDPLYEFNPLYDDRSYYASPKVNHHVESSVSKEARKRLSDRWKTTHLIDDEGPLPGGGSNTLGEMLALSDIMSGEKSRKDKGILGISSNDGWKDSNRNLSRSKSLPSSHARLNHRSGHRRRGSRASEFGMLKDVLNAGTVKGSRGEKTHVSDVSEGEESVLTEREIHVNSEELKLKDTNEDKTGLVAPTEEASTTGETITFDSTKQLEFDTTVEAIMKDEVVSPKLHDVTEKQEVMEHIIHSKEEEEQPSPNSTLESPFEGVADHEDEEASTSGCFEKISADLQELRMQLNLLKMDSVGEQGDIFLSSDEEDDVIEQTNCLDLAHSDHFRDEEERDFSYLLDVVTELGGCASTRDELLSLCYSLDCPVDPSVFTRLEKKYGHLVLWPKSERKMLFDLINYIVSEIIGSWVDGGKMVGTFRPKWERAGFVDDLWGKVARRRKEIEHHSEEIFLDASWSGMVGKGVDLVGRELENILHEDLICELVTELVYCN